MAKSTLNRGRAERAHPTELLMIDLAPAPRWAAASQLPAAAPAPTTQLGLFGNDQMIKPQAHAAASAQPLLFSQRDIAQFGVNSKPLLPIADATKLGLFAQDTRTDEERARDLKRAAEALTMPLLEPDWEVTEEHQRDYAVWLASLPTFDL